MITTVDLELLEIGNGKNPFEELIARVERLSLEGKLDVRKEDVEKTILFLERKYQDFSDSDEDKSMVIIQAVNANLQLFEHGNQKSFADIFENLNQLKYVVDDLTVSNKLIPTNYLITSYLQKNPSNKSGFTFKSLQKAYSAIFNNFISSQKEIQEWIIELDFEVDINERHKTLEFIHLFIEVLNSIEGVQFTLEDIKVGSIKAKIKAVFDDVTSKEEVKELLESTKLFAKGKLEKEFNESEKLESERHKNEIEADILKENLNEIKSDDFKEVKKLELESLKLDVERKQLENEQKKIELFAKKKKILQELLSEGIIQQKQFKMLINGLPFLGIQNGQLIIGENIDIIDDL
ncbi:MAG: hypothetical protein ACXIUQ_01105 [Cecembia sp.]